MPAILEPWACRRDVIRRAFAFDFDQNRHILQVLAIPLVERFQQLQSLTLCIHVDLNLATVRWRGVVGVQTRIEAATR